MLLQTYYSSTVDVIAYSLPTLKFCPILKWNPQKLNQKILPTGFSEQASNLKVPQDQYLHPIAEKLKIFVQ